MSTRLIPFQDGMKIGFGYDLVKGSPLTAPAVEGTVSAIKEAAGQRVQSHLARITDIDTLHQALGVSVDAGGSYFGVSADAVRLHPRAPSAQRHQAGRQRAGEDVEQVGPVHRRALEPERGRLPTDSSSQRRRRPARLVAVVSPA